MYRSQETGSDRRRPSTQRPRRICRCYECNGMIHRVQRGDTLYLISRKYGVSLDDVMDANPYINVYNLQPGEQICVPVAVTLPDDNFVGTDDETNGMNGFDGNMMTNGMNQMNDMTDMDFVEEENMMGYPYTDIYDNFTQF